jgi:hypothetical protein
VARLSALLVAFALLQSLSWVATADAQTAPPLFELMDPAADVRLRSLPTEPILPSNPYSDMVDIRSFRILGETEEALTLEIVVQDLRGQLEAVNDFGLPNRAFLVDFDVGAQPFHYTIVVTDYFFGLLPVLTQGIPETFRLPAWVCLGSPPPTGLGAASCPHPQPITATAVLPENRIVVDLLKDALLGRVAPVQDPQLRAAIPRQFGRGDAMSNLRVTVADEFPPTGTDTLPGAGEPSPSFLFTKAAANTRIALSLTNSTGPDARHVAFVPGEPTRIPVHVQNQGEGKRFINLSVEHLASVGIDAQLPASIEVPAFSERILELVLHAPEDTPHRTLSQLRLKGQSVGLSEEFASLRLDVQAALSPSPVASTFHFHARQSTVFGPVPAPALPVTLFAAAHWMNVLDVDPNATADNQPLSVGSAGFAFAGGLPPTVVFWDDFILDTPLARQFSIDPSVPAQVVLSMDSDTPMNVNLVAAFYVGDSFFGQGEAAAQLSPLARSEIRVPIDLLPDTSTVDPARGRPRVRLETHASEPTAFAGFGLAFEPSLYPGESHLILPIRASPPSPSKALLQPLHMYATAGAQEFVNPGESRNVEMVLLNQGDAADTVSLSVLTTKPGWSAQLSPSSSFALGKGESVSFAVIATAPPDSPEGDTYEIGVTASSGAHPGVEASVRVAVIVTRGVDLEDDEAYAAQEDTLARAVRDPPEKTPAFGWIVPAGAGILLAYRRRREP